MDERDHGSVVSALIGGEPKINRRARPFGVHLSAPPRDTPVQIIATLNKEVNAALADPRMRARIADLARMVLPGTPANMGKFIAEETDKWAKVVKFSGAKVD